MGETETLGALCSEIIDCEHKTAVLDPTGSAFSIGTVAMRAGRIDFSRAKRISEESYRSWTLRGIPEPGDLILAREAPVGEVVRVPPGVRVALGQRTVLLRPDPKRVLPRFLHFLLLGPQMQKRIQERGSGSTVAHLNVADIRTLSVPPLPAISAQRWIAGLLGALDDKIESNVRIRSLVERIVGCELSTRRTRQRWPLSTLSSIVDFNPGDVRPGPPDRYLNYIDIASVATNRIDSVAKLTWADAPSRARRAVRDGDVIYSTVRPRRRSFALVLDPPETTVASTGFAVLRPRPPFGSSLVAALIGEVEFAEFLDGVAHGSAYPAVSIDAMADYPVRLPSSEDALDFEAITMPLWRRFGRAMRESQTLAELRDTLLPELLSGRLRVPDAEELVESVK